MLVEFDFIMSRRCERVKMMTTSNPSGQLGAMAAVILLMIGASLSGCLGRDESPQEEPICDGDCVIGGDSGNTTTEGNVPQEGNNTTDGNETELEEQAQRTIDLWEGESRLLLILVHPTDSSPGLTTGQAESIMSDVNDWYVEVSGGKVWFNWSVAGWYALDDAGYSKQNAYQAAAENGYDLTQYDRFVVGLQDLTSRSMSTQGVNFYNVTTDDGTVQLLASRCDIKSFADTNSTRNTLTHELGHGFGLSHARFNGSIGGEVEPYGNQYDSMGSSSAWRHFGAVYKHQMGWLDDEQVELVTQSGDYTLKPLEGDGRGGEGW